ncbi:hypothetical protein FRB95_013913 [Tulasnella sp. JGI-2019a]|nr:hypothetical protein FRB95_013913 [Tulasnella sp. JGI-2019a]
MGHQEFNSLAADSPSPSSVSDTSTHMASSVNGIDSASQPGIHVSRPPNAWMLFRADYVRRTTQPTKKQSGNPSKKASYVWRNEMTEEDKRVWSLRADLVKEEHLKRNPGYKYRPVRMRTSQSQRQMESTAFPYPKTKDVVESAQSLARTASLPDLKGHARGSGLDEHQAAEMQRLRLEHSLHGSVDRSSYQHQGRSTRTRARYTGSIVPGSPPSPYTPSHTTAIMSSPYAPDTTLKPDPSLSAAAPHPIRPSSAHSTESSSATFMKWSLPFAHDPRVNSMPVLHAPNNTPGAIVLLNSHEHCRDTTEWLPSDGMAEPLQPGPGHMSPYLGHQFTPLSSTATQQGVIQNAQWKSARDNSHFDYGRFAAMPPPWRPEWSRETQVLSSPPKDGIGQYCPPGHELKTGAAGSEASSPYNYPHPGGYSIYNNGGAIPSSASSSPASAPAAPPPSPPTFIPSVQPDNCEPSLVFPGSQPLTLQIEAIPSSGDSNTNSSSSAPTWWAHAVSSDLPFVSAGEGNGQGAGAWSDGWSGNDMVCQAVAAGKSGDPGGLSRSISGAAFPTPGPSTHGQESYNAVLYSTGLEAAYEALMEDLDGINNQTTTSSRYSLSNNGHQLHTMSPMSTFLSFAPSLVIGTDHGCTNQESMFFDITVPSSALSPGEASTGGHRDEGWLKDWRGD